MFIPEQFDFGVQECTQILDPSLILAGEAYEDHRLVARD
jgi:hypothetical protein